MIAYQERWRDWPYEARQPVTDRSVIRCQFPRDENRIDIFILGKLVYRGFSVVSLMSKYQDRQRKKKERNNDHEKAFYIRIRN